MLDGELAVEHAVIGATAPRRGRAPPAPTRSWDMMLNDRSASEDALDEGRHGIGCPPKFLVAFLSAARTGTGRQQVCLGAALSASAALPLLCCRGPWQALRYSLPTLVWLSTATIHYKRARLQLGPVRTACVLFARCGAAAPPAPHCLRLCSRRLSRLQHPACPCYPPRRQVPHGCPKPSRHHRHALASAARVAPSVGSAWDASDVCAPWA